MEKTWNSGEPSHKWPANHQLLIQEVPEQPRTPKILQASLASQSHYDSTGDKGHNWNVLRPL